jgi:hypothetical protein
VRTRCGRELAVGRLRLDGLGRPVNRVTLDIGCQPHDREQVWASLTVGEARQLAAHLLAQAAAVLGEGAGAAPAPARRGGSGSCRTAQ